MPQARFRTLAFSIFRITLNGETVVATSTSPDPLLCSSAFADRVEAVAAEGITGGCGGGNLCLVFLTKAFGLA